MALHRFDIGQTVRLSNNFGHLETSAAVFRITGKLPALGNSPQYRLRCDDERHDRIATEDTLDAVNGVLQDGAAAEKG